MKINKLINFLILNSGFSTKIGLIRNQALPICSNCVHFIKHTNNYPYDPIPCDEEYGRCKLFGEINIITGVVEYDLARHCRLRESKCGNIGSKYKEKT